MKRIFLFLLVAAMSFSASAQKMTPSEKKVASLMKYLQKCEKVSQDPKKGATADPWFKLAEAYYDIYSQPTTGIFQNAQQMETRLILKDEAYTTEERVCRDTKYVVDCYADKDLYYDQNGILQFWIVKKPIMEGALEKCQEALIKAHSLDEFASKTTKYKELAEKIHGDYHNTGLYYYLADNTAKAEEFFASAAASTENKILNRVDTIATYYSGLMAMANGKPDQALELYKKCLAAGYTADGEAFANVAEIYREKGDNEQYREYLEKGFEAFPQNQQILIGLINYYISSNQQPDKIFELLHNAQANEPANASLYYVEGDIYKKLGDRENAAKYFQKSYDIDNSYIYGIVNKAILYYEEAIDFQDKANAELDDDKYNALLEEVNNSLKKAIEPFETSYKLAENDPQIQGAVAEYLKNIYFRFRTQSDEYMAAYEQYNAAFKSLTGQE